MITILIFKYCVKFNNYLVNWLLINKVCRRLLTKLYAFFTFFAVVILLIWRGMVSTFEIIAALVFFANAVGLYEHFLFLFLLFFDVIDVFFLLFYVTVVDVKALDNCIAA